MDTVAELNIRRILAPIDFSEYSERALAYAAAFAERRNAELVVLHVVQALPSGYQFVSRSEWGDAFETEARRQALQQMNEAVKRIPSQAVDVSCEIAIGNPADEIVECAARQHADLIIMSTHGRTGLKHVFIGSIAEATVRHAPCPVLVARQTGPGLDISDWDQESRLRFDTILVGIDFSPGSNEALGFAKGLIDETGGTLILTHVSAVHYPIGEAEALETPQIDADLLEAGERRLRQLAERETGKNLLVKHEVRQGSAGAEIAAVADAYNVDLAVVGTRGLTGVKRALLGSTAEYLIRHARCPVLVVRQNRAVRAERAAARSTKSGLAADIIATHPFLRTMSNHEVEVIVEGAKVVKFEPGEIIFRQGDYADSFYLVHEGRVVLEAHTPEQNIVIETIEGRDVLGWSWLFPPFAWHFQARAIERTVALQLNAARILIASEADDKLGHQLTKRIAQVVIHRLQTTQKRLAEECHGELALGEVL